jgi:hypothetical protein
MVLLLEREMDLGCTPVDGSARLLTAKDSRTRLEVIISNAVVEIETQVASVLFFSFNRSELIFIAKQYKSHASHLHDTEEGLDAMGGRLRGNGIDG